MRNPGLAVGEVYHVYTKSIAGFKIFSAPADCDRMRLLLRLCQYDGPRQRLSWLLKTGSHCVEQAVATSREGNKRIQLIAYCLMQTHLHLLVRQTALHGISEYMNHTLNSYTRYFNTKYCRKGPLWESRFHNTHVKTSDVALHMTRYIHLNPVTAHLVDDAGDWKYSSCAEYMAMTHKEEERLCEFRDIVQQTPEQYAKFLASRRDYQRDLEHSKKLTVDDPSVS